MIGDHRVRGLIALASPSSGIAELQIAVCGGRTMIGPVMCLTVSTTHTQVYDLRGDGFLCGDLRTNRLSESVAVIG